ncbi:hypothetical protein SALBM311S_11468 [Streptomyces alboniger]
MSWVCSSTWATPIAAKPSRLALRKGYGWKARTSRGVVRTVAASRAPVAWITSRSPALSVPSSVISKGTYAVCARPANWPAYAMRSPAMCSAV